jgi:ABC-2 type transport system permease protein
MEAVNYTLSVAWKEIQLIVRDRGWLAVLFLLPLLLGTVFGGINLQVSRDQEAAILLDVCLVNEDSGAFGAQVANAARGIIQLNIKDCGTAAEAERRVATGEEAVTVIIPKDFSQKIDAYVPVSVKVIVDPAQPQSTSIVTGIMNQIVSEVTIWGEVQYGVRTILNESGILAEASPQEKRAIEAQNLGAVMTQINQMRENPAIAVVSEDLEGAKIEGGIELFLAYLFPGFTVMFVFFIVSMAGAALLNERETGTLRRLLASPIPRGAIIGGKVLAYMALACAQVVVLLGTANLLLGMPLGSSPFGLVILSLVVAFVAAALGMLVAALARTAKEADNAGVILAFVMAGIGGAIPLSQAPIGRSGGLIGSLSQFTPHAHALEGYYRLMAENATIDQILPQIGILAGMGVLFLLIAIWRFKFEV